MHLASFVDIPSRSRVAARRTANPARSGDGMDAEDALAEDVAARQRLQRSGIFAIDWRDGTRTLRLRVSDGIGGGAETGGRVWSAALGLSAYLLMKVESPAASSPSTPCGWDCVVELGAGPGLPGLMLTAIGAARRVILTDAIPATVDNLEHNIRASLSPSERKRVLVHYLDWRDSPAANVSGLAGNVGSDRSGKSEEDDQQGGDGDGNCLRLSIDLVLAADVVYEPTLAEPLLATLAHLLHHAKPKCIALLAAERRGHAWAKFEWLLQHDDHARSLHVIDRSEEIRDALRRAECPFACAPDALARLVLLELSAAPRPRAGPPFSMQHAPSKTASPAPSATPDGGGAVEAMSVHDRTWRLARWRVCVSVTARSGTQVGARIGLVDARVGCGCG